LNWFGTSGEICGMGRRGGGVGPPECVVRDLLTLDWGPVAAWASLAAWPRRARQADLTRTGNLLAGQGKWNPKSMGSDATPKGKWDILKEYERVNIYENQFSKVFSSFYNAMLANMFVHVSIFFKDYQKTLHCKELNAWRVFKFINWCHLAPQTLGPYFWLLKLIINGTLHGL
jgi:hypothetical protein